MTSLLSVLLHLLLIATSTPLIRNSAQEQDGELANILGQEVVELTRDLTAVRTFPEFIDCVSDLRRYGQFAEPSLPYVVKLLEQNTLRPTTISQTENFRMVFTDYFDVIGPSALDLLIKIVKNTELLVDTRILACESILQIAQRKSVRSRDTASQIRDIMLNEWGRSGNSLIYTTLLRAYGHIAENCNGSQLFLIEILNRDDIAVKIPAIEAACESQKGSSRILMEIVQAFQKCEKPENRRGSPLLYTIIGGYGKLGLFDESIDAFLKSELETNDDPIWRLHCAEAMTSTRVDSATARIYILAELQRELSIRPVDSNGNIFVNRALSVVDKWEHQHLLAAEDLIIEVIREPSLDGLHGFAFDLLLKMQSSSVQRLADEVSKASCDILRLKAIAYHSRNSKVDADDLRFSSELLGDEYAGLSHRIECVRIISAGGSKAVIYLDLLERLWQEPGPVQLRMESFAAYNKINQLLKKEP